MYEVQKARSNNKSFWLMDKPGVVVRQRADGLCEVEVNGFDHFVTVRGELISGGKAMAVNIADDRGIESLKIVKLD